MKHYESRARHPGPLLQRRRLGWPTPTRREFFDGLAGSDPWAGSDHRAHLETRALRPGHPWSSTARPGHSTNVERRQYRFRLLNGRELALPTSWTSKRLGSGRPQLLGHRATTSLRLLNAPVPVTRLTDRPGRALRTWWWTFPGLWTACLVPLLGQVLTVPQQRARRARSPRAATVNRQSGWHHHAVQSQYEPPAAVPSTPLTATTPPICARQRFNSGR